MRRLTITALAAITTVGLAAPACTSDDDASAPDTGSGSVSTPGGEASGGRTGKSRWVGRQLTPFDDCDQLTTWLSDQAAERVGPYGLAGLGGGWGGERFVEAGMAVDDAALSAEGDLAPTSAPLPTTGDESGGGVAGEDYSTTNTQEAGVDEPDLVKTDGERLVTVIDGTLHLVDVTGDEPELLGSVRLEQGWGHELLLAGDRAFVLSQGDGSTIEALREDGADTDIAPYPYGSTTTVLQEVDLSNPERPTVDATQIIEGNYLTARVVDGVARVVVWSPPSQLDLVQPMGPGAEDAAEETNRQILAEAGVDQWIPSVLTVDGQGIADEEPLVECGDVGHPEEFAGFGLLTVLSVDTGAPLDTTDAMSIIADGQTVYASTDHLFVATNEWVDPIAIEESMAEGDAIEGPDYRTSIHAFDIADEGPASYLATGTVEGHLLNQFSMSEHEGVLRVATTAGEPWSGGSESMVTTLALEDQQLVELGQVGDMGEGEQIYAVRFIGETGYVVTFRQTDPLYVLDLSDPSNPRVTGELKIPGYSAYLHPVGDGLLLGVGQDATDEGIRLGVQVSLFDVSDPTNPERVHQITFGSGSSDVEYDHRAFLWWAPESMALVPMQTWDEGTQVSGGVGIDVAARTLEERGLLEAPTTDDCGTPVPIDPLSIEEPASILAPECAPYASPLVRTVVVGDRVLAISSGGVGTHDLATLGSTGFTPWS